jgi:hypothetical protein
MKHTLIGGFLFMAVVLAFAVLLLSPRMGHCAPQPTVPGSCDPADQKSCVQPLLEGEAAPFSGQLLTPRRAAKLAVEAGSCKEATAIEVEHAVDVWKLKLETEQRLRKNDQDAHQLEVDLLMKRMAQIEETLSPHWWERPVFVATASAVLTIGAVVLATWVIDSATPAR